MLLLEFRHDAFGLIFQTQMALQLTKAISRSAMVELFNFFLFFPFAVVKKKKITHRSKVIAQDLVKRPNLKRLSVFHIKQPKLTRVIYNRFRWKRETVAGAFAFR